MSDLFSFIESDCFHKDCSYKRCTKLFDELKEKCLEKEDFSIFLYSGKVYRVHQRPKFYVRGENKGKLKIKENQIKETKNCYTQWSKNPKVYDYIISDRSDYNSCAQEPFLLIEGNVKNGIDMNEANKIRYENYSSTRSYNEAEIIAPMNNENIERVFLVYDRNNKNKWVDVTDLLLKK